MSALKWDYTVGCIHLVYPKFKVKRFSDSRFMNFIYTHFLKWAGAVTICNTVYMRDDYFGTDRGASILKHEGAHVADWNKWYILMPLSYILLLPSIFTLRAVWEWHGYRVDLREVHDEYRDLKLTHNQLYWTIMDSWIDWVVEVFAGKNYFFMFPFKKAMHGICKRYVSNLK